MTEIVMSMLLEARERLREQGIPFEPEVVPGSRGTCPSCGHWVDIAFGNLCYECAMAHIRKTMPAAIARRKELNAKRRSV